MQLYECTALTCIGSTSEMQTDSEEQAQNEVRSCIYEEILQSFIYLIIVKVYRCRPHTSVSGNFAVKINIMHNVYR